jgi:lipopolysaccharide export system protein LptC
VSRGSIALAILLAAAAAALWLFVLREDTQAPSPTIESADLGYYLRDARLVGLDANGRPLYTLNAARIEQRASDGSVSLRQLTLDYAAESQTPWTASADTGRIPASADVIELEGNVRLRRTGPADAVPLEIDTTELELDVRERIARTQATVDLVQGGDTLTATGLEADLQGEKVKLGSRVRARFQGDGS